MTRSFRRSLAIALSACALLAVPATASAAVITGDAFNNTLYGTAAADTIDGKQGNDVLYGAAGNDLLKLGSGADTANGDAGDDVINADTVDGQPDMIWCGTGYDKVYMHKEDKAAGDCEYVKVLP